MAKKKDLVDDGDYAEPDADVVIAEQEVDSVYSKRKHLTPEQYKALNAL